MNARTTLAVLAGLAVGAAGALMAGPLDPPAGTVAATYKTLAEIEPRTAVTAANTPGDADSLFKITQPGSYYLTGNITGVSGKSGVEIAASGVTLDLNAFDLVGVAGSVSGITVNVPGFSAITVRNGCVRGWGDMGIDLSSVTLTDLVVADIRADGNSGRGISVNHQARITDCSACGNGSDGIWAWSGAAISDCLAADNGSEGIRADYCSVVTGCVSLRNAGAGISVSNACTVTACSAEYSDLQGIDAGLACTIRGCSVRYSTEEGIRAGAGSLIAECTSSLNTLAGIEVSSRSIILHNQCSDNGTVTTTAAGIRLTGGDNRVEGNNCYSNDRGIEAAAAGSLIIRNSCSANTINWSFVANNVYGPIIDRTAPASPAVSGSSASDTTSSTHPNANFSY